MHETILKCGPIPVFIVITKYYKNGNLNACTTQVVPLLFRTIVNYSYNS